MSVVVELVVDGELKVVLSTLVAVVAVLAVLLSGSVVVEPAVPV